MGEGDPNPALIPDFSMLDAGAPDPVSKRDYLLMHASWVLITDNLLDLSHVAFCTTACWPRRNTSRLRPRWSSMRAASK